MARPVSRSAATTAREVKVVFSRLRRRIQALALTDDLSGSQAAVLTRLHKEGPSSTSVLAGAEAVSHQAIGAILAVLEERGFIQRSPDPTDGRRQLISLTDAGVGKPKTPHRSREEWLARALQDGLTEDERRAVRQAMALLTGSPNLIRQQQRLIREQRGNRFSLRQLRRAGRSAGATRHLAAAAGAAQQAGASWFTMADHFFQMDNLWPAESPMLEVYTSLGYLAGQTERIKLVVLVNGVMYRYPGLLAKTVTTLDVLSRGRAVFGLGAAWYEREHIGLGVPYPPTAERFERLEETLQICRQMWSSDNGRYDGKHYQLAETLSSPQPIQRQPADPDRWHR